MFGNKGYAWKVGAALALIVALGHLAAKRGDTINPSVWRCLAEPRRWDGTEIWIPSARVTAVRERDYEIDAGAVRIRVAGPAPAPVEDRLSLVATYRASGPVLEPIRVRPLPQHNLLRRVMEIVSLLVAVAVLLNLARHFLFRPSALGLSGRTD